MVFLNSQSGIFIKSYQTAILPLAVRKSLPRVIWGHLIHFELTTKRWLTSVYHSGLEKFRNYEFRAEFWNFLNFWWFKWFKFKYNPVKQRALIKNPKRLIKNFELFFSRDFFFRKFENFDKGYIIWRRNKRIWVGF